MYFCSVSHCAAHTRRLALPYTCLTNVWFVDPSGVSRRTEIRKRGWRGPLKTVETAVKRAEVGDKIVLYYNREPYVLLYGEIMKDTIIWGEAGEHNLKPTLKIPAYRAFLNPPDDYKVWFKNLNLEAPKQIGGQRSTLWFQNCNVREAFYPFTAARFFAYDSKFAINRNFGQCTVSVHDSEDSELKLVDCVFTKTDDTVPNAIEVGKTVKVTMIGNRFSLGGRHPITWRFSGVPEKDYVSVDNAFE